MTNSQDLISIILPLYNKEDFLDAQLESLYFQTYKNWELIIINDCSTDRSKEIALSWKLRMGNKCSIYDNEKNLGMNKSIEHGLQYANGRYISYCDADDIWMRCKLEHQIFFLQQGSFDLVYCDMTTIDEYGAILKPSYIQSIHSFQNNTKNISFQKFVYSNHVTATSILFEATLTEEILPFPTLLYQDRRTILNASYGGKRIGFQNISLVYYRRFATAMSVKDSQDPFLIKKIKEYLESFLLHIKEKSGNTYHLRIIKQKIDALSLMMTDDWKHYSKIKKIYILLTKPFLRNHFLQDFKNYFSI